MCLAKEVLETLDKSTETHNFPFFEISTWATAKTKLDVFIKEDSDEWLIIFQQISFMISNRIVCHIVKCIDHNGYEENNFYSRDLIDFYEYGNLFDRETGVYNGDLHDFKVKLLGQKLHEKPSLEEYKKTLYTDVLDIDPSLLVTFYLGDKYKNQIFYSREELLAFTQRDLEYVSLISTESWEHPEIMSEKPPYDPVLPSTVTSFQQIAKAIEKEDNNYFQPDKKNCNSNDMLLWAKDYEDWI